MTALRSTTNTNLAVACAWPRVYHSSAVAVFKVAVYFMSPTKNAGPCKYKIITEVRLFLHSLSYSPSSLHLWSGYGLPGYLSEDTGCCWLDLFGCCAILSPAVTPSCLKTPATLLCEIHTLTGTSTFHYHVSGCAENDHLNNTCSLVVL